MGGYAHVFWVQRSTSKDFNHATKLHEATAHFSMGDFVVLKLQFFFNILKRTDTIPLHLHSTTLLSRAALCSLLIGCYRNIPSWESF